jgi:hypothetical protein
MAIIAIIVIVLFAAAVCGHFFVKKERRKQVEKRQQRVKIAEGDFDEIPVEAPKRKLFQRKRLELAPLPISEKQADELTAAAPGAVAAMIDSLNSYRVKTKAAADAASEYDNRKDRLSSFRFTAENGAVDLLALANLHRAVDIAAGAHYSQECEARAEHARLRDHLRTMDKISAGARGYDLSPLSPHIIQLLGVAGSMVEANPYEKHTASRSRYQVGDIPGLSADEDEKRQLKDIVTTEMTAIFVEALGLLWEPVRAVQTARKAVNGATAQLAEANKATPVSGPEKPSDQDVALYTSSVFDWVVSVGEAEDQVEQAHKELRDAVNQLAIVLESARQAGKEADQVALGRGLYKRSPVLKAGASALSVASWLEKESREQVSAHLAHAASESQSGEKGPVLEIAEEARLDASLRAAVRKLGFALAQEKAASMRGTALQEKGPPAVKADEPTLEAGSVDAYLAQFDKWTAANDVRATELTAHQQKASDLRDALVARTEQIGQVVQNLVALLEDIEPTAVISAELDTCIRAATWLADTNMKYVTKKA